MAKPRQGKYGDELRRRYRFDYALSKPNRFSSRAETTVAKGRELMTEWVVDALRSLGGRGTILDISRRVWERHEPDIRAAGDLLFEWQYELRWAGDLLRKDGVLRPADDVPRGMWELA